MPLNLVPPTVPDRKAAMMERIKAAPRPPGMYQCPRCGCRSMVTETTGGTITARKVCAACYKRGINFPMAPEIKKVD